MHIINELVSEKMNTQPIDNSDVWLDKIIILIIQQTINHLIKKKKIIHLMKIKLYKYILLITI